MVNRVLRKTLLNNYIYFTLHVLYEGNAIFLKNIISHINFYMNIDLYSICCVRVMPDSYFNRLLSGKISRLVSTNNDRRLVYFALLLLWQNF